MMRCRLCENEIDHLLDVEENSFYRESYYKANISGDRGSHLYDGDYFGEDSVDSWYECPECRERININEDLIDLDDEEEDDNYFNLETAEDFNKYFLCRKQKTKS